MGKEHVVLFSGGLDSSTLLADVVNIHGADSVLALSILYGQKHKRERASARMVSGYYEVDLLEGDLSKTFQFSRSALLEKNDKDVGEGSYAEQISESETGLVDTYVPYRNGIFLSYAAAIADSIGAKNVYYGAHADDEASSAYPDCSIPFVRAQAEAIEQGTGGRVKLHAPYLPYNKRGVLLVGLRLGVPYELTWSCYEGGEDPCGKCATCKDRQTAFRSLGRQDPLSRM